MMMFCLRVEKIHPPQKNTGIKMAAKQRMKTRRREEETDKTMSENVFRAAAGCGGASRGADRS